MANSSSFPKWKSKPQERKGGTFARERRSVRALLMQKSWRKKVKLAGLQPGHVHAQVHFNAGLGVAFSKDAEHVGKVETLLVLNQVGLGNTCQFFGAFHGVVKAPQLIHKAKLKRFSAGENPSVGVILPIIA